MLAAALLIASVVTVSHADRASAAGEGTILALVNQARASSGLGPLALNGSLSAVSTAWANQMAANGTMTHNPSYSTQIPGGWSKAAENVAQGYGSQSAVHQGWMNSAGHRANILGDFTDIGISFISAGGTTWAVQNFAKYGASVPPPAPPAPPPAPPAPAPPAPPAPPPAPPAPAPPAPPAAPPPAAPVAPASPQKSSPSKAAAPLGGGSATPASKGAESEPSADSAPDSASAAPTPHPVAVRGQAESLAIESLTSQPVAKLEAAARPDAALSVVLAIALSLLVASSGAWTAVRLRRRWLK